MFKLKGEFMTISELSKIFIKFESYLILILFSLGALYSIFDYIHETKKFNIDIDQLKKDRDRLIIVNQKLEHGIQILKDNIELNNKTNN